MRSERSSFLILVLNIARVGDVLNSLLSLDLFGFSFCNEVFIFALKVFLFALRLFFSRDSRLGHLTFEILFTKILDFFQHVGIREN